MIQLIKAIHRKHLISLATLFAAALAVTVFVSGCGGGGGGGGTGGPPADSGITFTGQTSPAVIDAANAREIAAEAYKGMQTGESMNPFSGLQAAAAPSAFGRPIAIDLYETLEDALIQADITEHAHFGAAAVQTESDTLDDDCGGLDTATYVITFDDVTGVFSGRFTFENFCSDGATFTGNTDFSGVVNVSGSGGELFNSFSFSFDNLTLSTNGASFTLDGDLNYASGSSTPTVTLDMYIQDNMSSEVVWVDDYRLVYNGRYVDISGTFYHHTHGRVTLVTEQDLDFGIGREYPSAGVMVFTGARGSAGGDAKVRIQAVSSTTCRITADIDGNASYDDFDSGIIQWTDLRD